MPKLDVSCVVDQDSLIESIREWNQKNQVDFICDLILACGLDYKHLDEIVNFLWKKCDYKNHFKKDNGYIFKEYRYYIYNKRSKRYFAPGYKLRNWTEKDGAQIFATKNGAIVAVNRILEEKFYYPGLKKQHLIIKEEEVPYTPPIIHEPMKSPVPIKRIRNV